MKPRRIQPWGSLVVGSALLVMLGGCSGGSTKTGAATRDTEVAPPGGGKSAPTRAVVFRAGEGDVDTFRIPAVTVTPTRAVVVVAEARTHSPLDTDPHHLVSKRSTDGGRTWSALVDVAKQDVPEEGCYPSNPVITSLAAGPEAGSVIVVFNPCRGRGGLAQTRSTDDGATWSAPVPLDLDATATVPANEVERLRSGPGHGIQLTSGPAKGRLVMVADAGTPGEPTVLALLLSDDGGKKWRIGASVSVDSTAQVDPDESAVVALSNGNLLVSARNAASPAGRLQLLVSSDGEKLLSDAPDHGLAAAADLKVPSVEGSLLTLPKTDKVVFSSPSDPLLRRGLRLWSSTDGGKWEPGPLVVPGAAGYSDLVRLDDATIAVVVESGERQPYEEIDLYTVPVSLFTVAGPPLPPLDSDVADAVAGRLLVDGVRYPVRRFCLVSPTIDLGGGQVSFDLAAGIKAIKVKMDLDGRGQTPAMVLTGTMSLDLPEGIVFRGPLDDETGAQHDVDLVIVNVSPCR